MLRPDTPPRTRVVSVRLTVDEADRLRARAARRGLLLSDHLRDRLLNGNDWVGPISFTRCAPHNITWSATAA